MNTMQFATAPWGVFPADVSNPMPSQVQGTSGEPQNAETKPQESQPEPLRPQKKKA